ncbi:hypothetical protein [Legionella longbeachae]|nr:hypothetical protein [Legionella longbeachae]
MSYVGAWILNSGYDQAILFVQQEQSTVDLVAQNTVWQSAGGGGGALSD